MKEIFIIGSKGIPANYGGFEAFLESLTKYQKSDEIHYHIACLGKENKSYVYHGADCFQIKVPNIGAAKAVYYDLKALKICVDRIKKENLTNAVIYILACRIGPFLNYYKKNVRGMNCKIYVNPDGHEWKRAKWNKAIQKYWKISERYMVKHADLLICDSKNMEHYIKKEYHKYRPRTCFIAYGSETNQSSYSDEDTKVLEWYEKYSIHKGMYYLIVGRFVPENNYETMIREFMSSNTKRELILITNVEKNKFYETLKENTHFERDKRIKFVGTVYDQELLKKIRENAYGYLHGHEVGGTNPSLLEALGTTCLNLLLDVGFNREVGEDGAVYWKKERGNLKELIERVDGWEEAQRAELERKAKARIQTHYNWNYIVGKYEKVLMR